MNIHELDSYNLGDAVKFNDKLNPRIWGADEKMRPEVREQLLKIADDFREFLGIDVEVQDITVSGSNAAFTYTPHSDIDLHLVVDLPAADRNDVYRELFDAKKYAYNEQHDIRIGGYDVELYVQDANKKHHSQGIYSIMNNDWVSVPKRRRPDVDDISVKSKFEDLGHRIETAIKSQDYEKISAMVDKLKDYRQAGLDAHGEFGPENLAFKILRTQGLIKKLYNARSAAKDELLSLDERRKKKKKKSVKYGYGGYWYPGYAYAGQDHPAGTEGGDGGGDGGGESMREDASMTWDGVNPTTCMFLNEQDPATDEDILQDFVDFCVKELKIEQMPRVRLRRDPQWPAVHKTFGRYNDENKTLEVAWGQRHIMDVLRTVAHELTHKHQHEREGDRMGPDAGETGSPYENEANARAGVLMRDYGRLHPEYFTAGQTHDLEESASGYIPTKKQAKDPRFSMALTVDIKPGQVGKEANKLKLKTDRQGQPQIAQANGLFEELYREFKQYKTDEDYSPDEPPGPEFKPTMPKGTVRVDVSDVYDWYKLGQHISNLKGLGQHDFGAGPPSSIISFGDEDTEHEFIKDLKATGLDVTDIDPKDPKRRAGKTIKTDPAYNVDEAIQAPVSKQDRATQDYYKFIVGKIKLGRVLNRQEQEFLKMYNLKRQVAEYAVTADRDDDDTQGPDYIEQLANRWWNAADPVKQERIAAVLRTFGYAISQVESEDDAVQLTDIKSGHTYFISADDFDPDLFEISDELRQNYLGRAGQQVDRRQEKMARVRDRLNKGYEIYHAEDPTRTVHRFEANTAADARRYYENFITRYESDRDFDLQLRRATGLMESEELDEVNMSPGALEKFATSDAAKGIRAGFEAELIFRDTQGESDEMDPEPDYDADERAYSISQVIEFFDNDEYGYGLGDRERNRLEEALDETYMTWRDEQMTSDFRNDAEDLVREIHLDEVPLSERIIKVLTDGMEIDDAEADKILALGVDAPKFNSSSEQAAYAEQNPNYKIYLEALDDAEAILDEEVETSIEKQDGYYDQALDDYRDNYSGDDDSFFSDVGLRWMSDIANEYGLDWPVWNMDSRGNNGSRDWDEIGAELQQVVGMPVKVSSNYHSTPRKEGQWIIEPDGSLNPDDRYEEAGLEIVSPPMPLLVTLEKLKQVTDWANDPNGGNAYTNASTGLHMGVSLPTRGGDVDYVKLILFMGDKYVQEKFGREANNFCASALNKLQQNIKGGKSDPAGVIKLLKHGLTELAYKELQKGVGSSKYTSAHLQNGYIEFRSPGGDWLAKADEEIDILENTMLRFARAMAIAGDPSADRQEYAKKLYKLVTSDNEQYADQLRLFSEYSAGTIDKEQLKKQWAEKTIGKEKEINQRWKLYQLVNGTWTPVPAAEWNGYTEDQVKNAVWSKYGREALDSGEYQLVNMGEQEWEVYDVKTGNTLEIVKGKSKGEVADAVYDKYVDQGIGFQVRPYEDPAKLTPRAKLAKRITTKNIDYNYDIVSRNSNKVMDRFYAKTPAEADKVYGDWLKQNNLPNDTEDYGYRKSAQAADNQRDSADLQRRLGVQDVDTDVAQNFAPDYSAYERNSDRIDAIRAQQRQAQDATQRSGSWSIYDVTLGREISRMDNVPWQQANDRAEELERSTGHDMSVRGLSESIDPVSGAGAVLPRQDPKNTGKKAVTPAEKVFKNPVKGQPYRSAIGQAISQQDLENMTQQIQVARKLGDSVMEMEDTPSEVLRALDQAAQKNGYRNWADVKANPRSEHAVMNVAKLANNIMKTAGPHHEKLFYKSKTDENFADGKNPGRKGLSRRVGIPKKATLGQLEKIAKSSTGERRKMAQWQLNMRRGKAKKK
jgi:hypothetical protein